MKTRSLLLVSSLLAGAFLLSPTASAATRPDLRTTIAAPSSVFVYDSGAYVFTVANIGTKNATGVTLQIQLPQTHTSPTVHVMGVLGAFDPRCTRTGTVLNCTLGTIVKATSTTVTVNIALPYSSAPIVFNAVAPPVVGETNTANNNASLTADPLTYAVSVAPPESAINRHCTGTNLTSFYECELYPSSISSFNSVLELDGSVTISGAPPGFGGDWSMPDPDHLVIDYYDTDGPAGTLDAYGVGANCFEGPMNFYPASPYVALYEVCLQ